MLNRRLVVLFILFVLGFIALGLRLGYLQIAQADQWKKEMWLSLHHPARVETARGSILDRNDNLIAYDKPSYYLAMDYRALSYDDRWLARTAIERLKARGEKFANREQRARRIAETKAQIREQIDAIPAVIAKTCVTSDLTEPTPDAPPLEKVLARIGRIRKDIYDLHIRLWENSQVTGEGATAAFNMLLKDEQLAHVIIGHIDDEVSYYFKAHADDFPGLYVLDSRSRVYPYKSVACQLLGTLRTVDGKTLKEDPFRYPDILSGVGGKLKGYRDEDRTGESGIEKFSEQDLRGTVGYRVIEDSIPGEDVSPAVDENTAAAPDREIAPAFGKNVKLTLDIELQKDIEAALNDPSRKLLKGRDGADHFVALVVLSLDGDVLAMVSLPGFDPNTIDDNRSKLISDEYRRPTANRALQAYQPGSIVKPLLATGALAENLITPETSFTCNGYLFPGRPTIFRCDSTHGTLQLADAITRSCNVYFYNVGQRLGINRLSTWYGHFGLGRDTGFELPESDGKIPEPARITEADVALNDSTLLGIGQGPILVTPLQMANAYATLLRGGKLISPRLVATTVSSVSQTYTVSASNLSLVQNALHRVTTVGTAKKSFVNFHLPVGGKTGTADTKRPAFDDEGHPIFDPERPLHNADGTPRLGRDGKPMFGHVAQDGTDAWFVGFAPAENPKVVVAAVMEFGGHGGEFAAPMVREAFVQLEKHGYLPAMDLP